MSALSSFSKRLSARVIAGVLVVAILALTVAPSGIAVAEDAPLPNVSIGTGDAAAVTQTGTQANTNTVDTNTSPGDAPATTVPTETSSQTSGTPPTSTDTETPPVDSTNTESTSQASAEETPVISTETEDASNTQSTEEATSETSVAHADGNNATASSTLDLVNDATANNATETVAETGDNVATTTKGNSSITTGNAFAFANLINVLNTNIIDSYGFLLFLNALFGQGNIDLRGLDFSGTGPLAPASYSTPCNLEDCQNADVNNLGISNTAYINNSVIVRADTGGNTATGTNAYITTGDAVAGANIVNVANTNIINSNYLLLAVNQIGNYSGDIVLPGFSFFDWFLKSGAGVVSDTSITNTATVNNNVDVVADTGNNAATSTRGTAEIETGDASAATSVSNVVNTNIMGGGAPVYILLNIMGNWSGQIFGLPQGLLWAQTPTGIVIYSEENAEQGVQGSATLNNTAEVNNNIKVFALTGDNKVDARREASIKTGDAYAATNIFNLINTNIVGRNLMLAVLNIMGDWSGNITFGMPDLFVGAQLESQHNPLIPGSPFSYKIIVRNNGDLPATNVSVDNTFDEQHMLFGESLPWAVGTLSPGEVREITLYGQIASAMNYGEFPSTIKTVASLAERDGNPEDNTEEIPLTILNNPGRSSLVTSSSMSGVKPSLSVSKTASVTETTAPGNVEYTIVVKNSGGEGYNGELFDTLKNTAGDVINEQAWDLGTIKAGESITVTYTMQFTESTKSGVYTNEAQVFADVTPSGVGGAEPEFVESNISSKEVLVVSSEEESILPEACLTYITSYLKYGRKNDLGQMNRLQTFLHDMEGHEKVKTNGAFDAATLDAVQAFQRKYASDILSPWGILNPTGYVYYTTQKKINEIYCKTTFNLSPEQIEEITKFKSRIERSDVDATPLPPTSDVGVAPVTEPVLAKEPEQEIVELSSALTAAAAGAGESASTSITKWIRGSLSSLKSRLGSWSSMRDLFNFRY